MKEMLLFKILSQIIDNLIRKKNIFLKSGELLQRNLDIAEYTEATC